MTKCNHYEICGIEDNSDSKDWFCILHSKDPKKDKGAFEDALKIHRKTKGDDFRFVVFTPFTNFRGVTFRGANFSDAIFTGKVEFRECEFIDYAYFVDTIFRDCAFFDYAKFFGETNFGRAEFNSDANFLEAKFEGSTKQLSGKTYFRETNFFGLAQFYSATFIGGVDFVKANFAAQANFTVSNFESLIIEDTDSLYRIYTNEVLFDGAIFKGKATFRETNFKIKISFNRAEFESSLLFIGKSYEEPIFNDCRVNIADVWFEKPDAIIFRNADLRKCRLVNTDVRKVEFTSVIWPKKGGVTCVFDEIFLFGKDYHHDFEAFFVERTWGSLERLYRELKQNYEDRKDYGRAGDFHYKQKEAWRKNPTTTWYNKLLLITYRTISGYSEHILPGVLCLFIIIFSCTAFYLHFGITPADSNVELDWNLKNWWITFHYSLQTSFLLKPEDYEVRYIAQYVRTAQLIISPIILGLIALAIRQRMKR